MRGLHPQVLPRRVWSSNSIRCTRSGRSAEAYIKSQRHEGWRLLAEKYDEGGYSGGNLERPALKRLVADIRAGKVQTVVSTKLIG